MKTPLPDWQIESNGHLQSARWDIARRIVEVVSSWRAFLQATSKGTIPSEVELPSSYDHCGECGEPLKAYFEADTIHISSESGNPCPHPRGLDRYSVEIDVPTGELVIANDLRKWFGEAPTVPGEFCDLQTNIGLMRESQAYARLGLGYGFVGNSCPHVYLVGPDSFELGYGEKPKKKALGYVCTDLWWYSIADKSRLPGFKKSHLDMVVTVTPGRYQLTHSLQARRNSDQKFSLVATLERMV